jgi:hypothetical protein
MLELDIFHKCRGNLTLHPSSKSEGRHEPSRFDLSQMQPLSSLGNSNQLYNHTTNTAWDGRLPQQVDILSECGTPTRPWFLPITKLHASSAAKLDISSGYDPSLQDMLRRLQQWKSPDDLEPRSETLHRFAQLQPCHSLPLMRATFRYHATNGAALEQRRECHAMNMTTLLLAACDILSTSTPQWWGGILCETMTRPMGRRIDTLRKRRQWALR